MKYHAHVSIDWNFSSKLPFSEIIQRFEKEFSKYGLCKIDIKPLLIKEKTQLGEFTLNDVLPFVSSKIIKKDYVCGGQTHTVKMNSQRYFLFRECNFCVVCGLQGSIFSLEYHEADKTPHFNLYGIHEGNYIQLTRDHIRPKSAGGADHHSNYQTMCSICNNLKGHSGLHLHELKKIRHIYDEQINKISKKRLHLLIEKKKCSFQKKQKKSHRSNKRTNFDGVVLNFDLNVYKKDDELFALPMYDDLPKNLFRVGCLKRGQRLNMLLMTYSDVLCELADNFAVIIKKKYLKIQ